jgi:cytochrome c oxidase subunit II
MSRLIVLIVIVLGVLAIAQLVRLYELSSKLRDRREEDIPNRDNKLNATLLLAFMIFMFGGFIWLMLTFGWTGRGDAASLNGVQTDWLLNLNFWIIIIVFFITNALLFGFAYKYVRKPGVKAYYFPHDNRLELAWTVVPAIVLAIIIILGLRSWNDQTSNSSKEAIRVELFSKQFAWTVRMSGEDNKLGLFDYKLTNGNNPLALMTTATIQDAIDSMENGMGGIRDLEMKLNDRTIMLIPEERELMVTDLDRKERLIRMLYQMKARHDAKLDAQAWDDLVFSDGDTLVLKQNQEYEFNFRAKDVIHSAYFPHFRAQMNTVPGMTTRFKFTPTITTKQMRKKMNDSQFNYILMCNKICGSAHYKMKLMVVVLSPGEYDKWYKGVSGQDKSEAGKGLSKVFKDIYALNQPKEAATAGATGAPSDSLIVGGSMPQNQVLATPAAPAHDQSVPAKQ